MLNILDGFMPTLQMLKGAIIIKMQHTFVWRHLHIRDLYLLQPVTGFPTYPSMHLQIHLWPVGVPKALAPQGHLTQGSPQVLLASSQYLMSIQSSSNLHSRSGSHTPSAPRTIPGGQMHLSPSGERTRPLLGSQMHWLPMRTKPSSVGHLTQTPSSLV